MVHRLPAKAPVAANLKIANTPSREFSANLMLPTHAFIRRNKVYFHEWPNSWRNDSSVISLGISSSSMVVFLCTA